MTKEAYVLPWRRFVIVRIQFEIIFVENPRMFAAYREHEKWKAIVFGVEFMNVF